MLKLYITLTLVHYKGELGEEVSMMQFSKTKEAKLVINAEILFKYNYLE